MFWSLPSETVEDYSTVNCSAQDNNTDNWIITGKIEMHILYLSLEPNTKSVKDACKLLNAAAIVHATNLHTMQYLHQFTSHASSTKS